MLWKRKVRSMKCKNTKKITEKAKYHQAFSDLGREANAWSIHFIGRSTRCAISRAKRNLLNLDSVGFSAHLFKVFGKSNLKVIGVRAIERPNISNRGKYVIELSRKLFVK